MRNQENFYLFKFAWKSIRRNRGRSFFIGFSVSLAVLIAVWVVSFFEGMNHQIEEAVVNTNTGYFQLQDSKYAKSTDSSAPGDFSKLPESILAVPGVKAYSPELVLDGNLSTPEGAAGLIVLGIDPELHARFLPIAAHLSSGEFLKKDDEDSIIIGEALAQTFKFQSGDQLVLNYQDAKGELRSEILQIKGIYHFNSRSFENRFVYISQRTWQKLFFNQASGTIFFNRIAVMAKDLSVAKSVEARLEGTGLKLRTWKNLNPEMAVVLEFHDGMIKFFFVIIGMTIIMTILTPVQMLWQERLKELRMLNIIGVSAGKFWKIGFFEVVQMIVTSFLFSTALLLLIIGIQSRTGLDFSSLNDGVAIERAGIKLPPVVYPLLSSNQILQTFLFVLVVIGVSYSWAILRTLQKLKESP